MGEVLSQGTHHSATASDGKCWPCTSPEAGGLAGLLDSCSPEPKWKGMPLVPGSLQGSLLQMRFSLFYYLHFFIYLCGMHLYVLCMRHTSMF